MPGDAEAEDIINSVKVNELFKIGARFYKEKNGKGLHLSYQDNLKLVAYVKQVLHGPLSISKAPEIGYFDVIGNDRREAWKQLKDLPAEDAMKNFIEILKTKCPSFLPYVAAHLKGLDDFNGRPNVTLNGCVSHSDHHQLYDPDQKFLENEDLEEFLASEKYGDVKKALYAQIYPQLQTYAQQHFPNDDMGQNLLISQLAQQYWDKYRQQLLSSSTPQTKALQAPNQEPSCNGYAYHTSTGDSATLTHTSSSNGTSIEGCNDQASSQNPSHTLRETDVSTNEDANEDGGVISSASMWTRKDIKEFKDDIKKNHKECILKIGQGETVTIRVPTHEDGSSLFWEFATDYYDLAFGILFEWTEPASNKISIMISESSEEEEEEDEEITEEILQGLHKMDLENGNLASCITSIAQSQNTTLDDASNSIPSNGSDAIIPMNSRNKPIPIDEIIPVYRRECHQEVYAGTHPYPGRGVYLLKFDNSYSLWRSKTLYYKVYYTK